jgi:hypothetical protein
MIFLYCLDARNTSYSILFCSIISLFKKDKLTIIEYPWILVSVPFSFPSKIVYAFLVSHMHSKHALHTVPLALIAFTCVKMTDNLGPNYVRPYMLKSKIYLH